MKIFFDSNVWISAFALRGFCTDLLEIVLETPGEHDLWTSDQVIAEVMRTLDAKFTLSDAARHRAKRILATAQMAVPGKWRPADDFPDPDAAPILAAALAAGAEIFVTGDKALLALGAIEGLPIVDPRVAYLRLRGLL